jgi:hypothetical protein
VTLLGPNRSQKAVKPAEDAVKEHAMQSEWVEQTRKAAAQQEVNVIFN